MRTIPCALAAGAAGIALGVALATLRPGGPSPASDPTGTPEARDQATRDLEALLAAERGVRESLEQEVARLRQEIEQRDGALATEVAPATEAPAAVAAGGEPRFDPDALEALGFRSGEIDRLRERNEQLELDELYLHNQARREGWLGRGRYRKEQQALRDEAILDLGYDGYDAIRYARGEKNRVVVARLLPNSQAASIGLQAGDALLRYGGDPVLDPISIANATATGVAGQQTELRIERDGQELRFFLPRGPIGVQLGSERRAPRVR